MPTRKANASWEGGLKDGRGRFDGESGAIGGDFSFGSRFGDAGGTNPEELLAAAEAACYSMALSLGLEGAGHKAERVHTEAACTIESDNGGFTITTMKLDVTARVPGIDNETFQKMANDTKDACPVSKALAGVTIELEAKLEN